MSTKIEKKPIQPLAGVYVDITKEEIEAIKSFFSFRGMHIAFHKEYPGYKKTAYYSYIETGSFEINMLRDLRQFIEDHKEEVKEFLKKDEQ